MRVASLIAATSLVLATRTARAADDEKNWGAALMLSLGGTIGSFYLTAESDSRALPALLLVSAPSWGHFYTGNTGLAVGGIAVRLAGVALIISSAGRCKDVHDPEGLDDNCDPENEEPSLAYIGGALIIGSAIAGIIDAPFAAKRHNARRLHVAPVVTTDQVGAMLGGRF